MLLPDLDEGKIYKAEKPNGGSPYKFALSSKYWWHIDRKFQAATQWKTIVPVTGSISDQKDVS